MKLGLNIHDLQLLIDIFPILCALCTVQVKFYNCIINADKFKQLMNGMIHDWETVRSEEEMRIMHDYAEKAKLFGWAYAVNLSITVLTFLAIPLIPRILDVIAPLNESRPRMLLYEAEYFIDEDKYFFPIMVHMSLVAAVFAIIIVSADMMFLYYVLHACGLFVVCGHRFQHALDDLSFSIDKNALGKIHRAYQKMNLSIESHNRAIRFAALCESSYIHAFFLQFGNNVLCLSVTLMEISLLMGERQDLIKYFSFALGQCLHLLLMCYPGQILTDHFDAIFTKSYEGLWYHAPTKMQKFVVLAMRRSIGSFHLTAGGIFILSIETFAMVLKTSVSYFTVLSAAN